MRLNALPIARAALVAGAGLLPIVALPALASAFVLPKTGLVCLVAVLLCMLWPFAARCGAPAPHPRWVALGTAVLIAAGISALASPAPSTAFWGAHGRYQGWVTYAAYCVWFWAGASLLQTATWQRRMMGAVVLGGALTAIGALAQTAGLDPFAWEREFAGRAFSSLGNPVYLAMWEGMALWLGAGLWLQAHACRRERGSSQSTRACTGWPGLWLAATLLTAAGLAASLGRAGHLALAVTATLWPLLMGRRLRQRWRRAWAGLLVAVLAVVLLVNVFAPRSTAERLTAGLASRSGPVAYREDASLPERMVGVRWWIWRGALGAVVDAPLLGTGPEMLAAPLARNFYALYPKERRGGLQRADRAHSLWLHQLATLGLFGFSALAALLAAAFVAALRAARALEPSLRIQYSGGLAGLIAFATAGLGSFGLSASCAAGALLLGSLALGPQRRCYMPLSRAIAWACGTLACIAAVIVACALARTFVADAQHRRARVLATHSRPSAPQGAVTAANQAVRYAPWVSRYRQLAFELRIDAALGHARANRRASALRELHQDLRHAESRSSPQAARMTLLGVVRLELALAQSEPGLLKQAVDTLERSLRTNPLQPRAHHALGRAQLIAGRVDAAAHAFAELLRLRPDAQPAQRLYRAAAALKRARAAAHRGAPKALLQAARRALAAEPPDLYLRAHAHNLRGAALVTLGKTKAGRAAWHKALRLVPGFAPAVRNIEALHGG